MCGNMHPEECARLKIDAMLNEAGWEVVSRDDFSPYAPAVANIVEGNLRHDTSKETEMKLTDVARASIAELQSDYFNWILAHGQAPWSKSEPVVGQVNCVRLDYPALELLVLPQLHRHKEVKRKYDVFFNHENGHARHESGFASFRVFPRSVHGYMTPTTNRPRSLTDYFF